MQIKNFDKRYYKRCSKCGLLKTIESFHTHKRDGVRNYCKVCQLKINRDWVLDNRERRNEYMRNYMRLRYLKERKINYEHVHTNNGIVWA
jgi:hypothetical protein